MSNLKAILVASLIIPFAVPIVFAQHMHQGDEHGMMENYESTGQVPAEDALVDKKEPIEVGNKICPVSGEEIVEDEVFKVEYEGKIYNLCCKMCAKDFKKNPQKYIEKLEKMEEGQEHLHEGEEQHEGHHHQGHHGHGEHDE